MTHAIVVDGLTFAYGTRTVLHGIHLHVPWGSITGCLGPNGAGKSTTLRLLVGLEVPAAGTVRIDGRDPRSSPEARAKLGFIPDGGGLYALLTPREHLDLVAGLHGLDDAVRRPRQGALVERYGLGELLDQRIDTLSKGQRQRVALVVGLLHAPRILVLDEPLAGLDAAAVASLRAHLRAMADQGCAILYSSHVLDVVERTADRTVVLHEGRVVAEDDTAALLDQPDATLEAVFLRLTRHDPQDEGRFRLGDGLR